MSFIANIKEELFEKTYESDCCKLAFLYGVVLSSSTLSVQKGEFLIVLNTYDAGLFSVLNQTVKQFYGEELVCTEESFLQKKRFTLSFLPTATRKVFEDLNLATFTGEGVNLTYVLNRDLLDHICCLKAFIQGVFATTASSNIKLAGDDITVVTSTGYHVEFVLSNDAFASDFAHVLSQFDITPKKVAKGDFAIIYLSDYQSIKNLLGTLGTYKALLNLENESIAREMRKNANREGNSMLANIYKQVIAGQEQVEAIKSIAEKIGLKSLPPQLRELAEARLQYPEENLAALTQFCKTPITKSGVNHRMRKIMKIAKETQQNQ